MPSCSAVLCGWSWAAAASRRALSRPPCVPRAPSGSCRSARQPGRRWRSCASSMAEAAPFGRGRLRRLLGLDRSGPPPRQTQEGEPLNPWTVPNLVGYLRLAALPVFLYVAFESGDGRSAPAAILFWAIAAGDYLDGLLARITGQYSRLGALLDPLVDRL